MFTLIRLCFPRSLISVVTLTRIIFLLSACCTASSIVDDFRQACPYSNFCKTPRLRELDTADDVIPCCYDCFCDEDCQAHGDCCPDVDANVTNNGGLVKELDCKPTFHQNKYTASLLAQSPNSLATLQHHRVIDFCPHKLSPDHAVYKKCTGLFDVLPNYDDVVLVSDEKSRIFKNKYCALCHGVSEFTRWNFVVESCRHSLDQLQLPLSELIYFILNHCVIQFERPVDVSLNSRTLTCNLKSCSNKDSDFYKGCLNGPHMPYISWDLYKNAMCYKCRHYKGDLYDFCSAADYVQKSLGASFKFILDFVRSPVATVPLSQSKCKEAEIYDPLKDGCTRMYCPPFKVAEYGHCTKMSAYISNLHLEMRIVFPLADQNLTMDPSDLTVYNESLRELYLESVIQEYGFFKCSVIFFTGKVLYEKNSHQLMAILITIRFAIQGSCSLEYIGRCIDRKKHKKISLTWVLGQNKVVLSGQISFFDISMSNHNEFYIITYTGKTKSVNSVRAFFFCRYVILDLADYKAWVMKADNNSLTQSLSKLSFTTWMFPGFYALSENKVAVCVETYLPSIGSTNIKQLHLSIPVAMILAVLFGI